MKRTLNPNLVWQKWPTDKTFPFEEHWVFLREQRDISPQKEVGIGFIEVEEVAESEGAVAQLRCQLRETKTALSALSGIAQDREPHIVLTRECFGFLGPVRLLIYSDKPFSSVHE